MSLDVCHHVVDAGGRSVPVVARPGLAEGDISEPWDRRPSSSSSWTGQGTLTPAPTTTSLSYTKVGRSIRTAVAGL